MGRNPATGIIMGGVAIGLALLNIASDSSGETPPASVQILNFVLLGLGAVGLLGSLVAYLAQKTPPAPKA